MTEKKKLFVLCVALFCFMAVSAQQRMSVSSPDGKLRFSLKVTSESVSYDIDYRKQPLITNSLLGFSFDSGEFGRNLKAGKVQRKKIDETYKLIVGKTSSVRSRCNEMTVPMQERSDSGRLINLVVRAFDDGIAFRYEFPEQKAWDSYVMYDERTQFNLQGNPMALLMYLPGYVNTHEGVYSHVRYDKVARKRLIEMPATFEFDNGVAVAITEAGLIHEVSSILQGSFRLVSIFVSSNPPTRSATEITRHGVRCGKLSVSTFIFSCPSFGESFPVSPPFSFIRYIPA